MEKDFLIPHLFRTEYSKIVAVLVKIFSIQQIEVAQDIVSDTFLQATELWGQKGLPDHPVAWLYSVAKNKTRDHLRRHQIFYNKIVNDLQNNAEETPIFDIDLSDDNINDSQLKMMFALCDPVIPIESQIALSLNILCGFGGEEIADALLLSRESIYKRLKRGKEKLRKENILFELPAPGAIQERMDAVLRTLYLLFSEGYYSISHDHYLRKELCVEAMRLTFLLVNNEYTSLPKVNALMALMCFHSSRFEARYEESGEMILYEDQNPELWNKELIQKGEYYLNRAAHGNVNKYHLEAAIAFWYTRKEDTSEKWEQILQLYNRLLQLEYSPITSLNRTFAVAKAKGILKGIEEAEKLELNDNHLFHTLLGSLYSVLNKEKALGHFEKAIVLAKTSADKMLIQKKMKAL